MLLSVDITEKSFGNAALYDDLHFSVQTGEIVGLIGRNGAGKSTLFNIISGRDTDFQGTVQLKRGSSVIVSRQEHHGLDDYGVLEYVQQSLPEFERLSRIIDTYPAIMGSDTAKIQRYSEALERFGQLGYYQVEDEVAQLFEAYQLDPALLHARMADLSGGQKRMVELVKVQRSRGDLALIDEPTNHMDSIAKQAFIGWLQAAPEAVLVVTHDRDVLKHVDRIIEIRDGRAAVFRGNYDQYLATNASQISGEVNEYELTQRRIANLREDVTRFRRLKERSRDPGTIRRFKSQQEKAEAELERLLQTDKPSFWIDQESAKGLNTKLQAAYQKHKARTIRLDTVKDTPAHSRLLLQATHLELGYGQDSLFMPLDFQLREGERLRLHGRNGAGKSTLIDAIMALAENRPAKAVRLGGSLSLEREVRIGYYRQEIADNFLQMTLADGIEQVLRAANQPVNTQEVRRWLSNYLFDPEADGEKLIARLSGGQKARFQLIRMLSNQPQLLILDEPTNHLDLPSIEELEHALLAFTGAILYVSHDSYFAAKLGGQEIKLQAS